MTIGRADRMRWWARPDASRGNARPVRPCFDRRELAGALGDLGTFLPLLVAMSARNGLDFSAALFFAGLFNVCTGWTFGVPMAVQPMKAIAAVALAEGLTAAEVRAAGFTVGAVLLGLALTGGADALARWVPRTVVRGVQLALGVALAGAAWALVGRPPSQGASPGVTSWSGEILVALAATTAAVALGRARSRLGRRIPAGLVLVGAGLGLAAWRHPGALAALALVPWRPHWTPFAAADVVRAFPTAALPQLPVTLLNSVVAVCALSRDLFPDRPADPRRIAMSVGVMNVVGAPFGAMPMCHGAGGLAGQVRFGARTHGSLLALGAAKMAAAVLFGTTLAPLAAAFPPGVLAVMLATSGLALTAGTAVGTGHVGLGVVAGGAAVALLALVRPPAVDAAALAGTP